MKRSGFGADLRQGYRLISWQISGLVSKLKRLIAVQFLEGFETVFWVNLEAKMEMERIWFAGEDGGRIGEDK